jgi:hypothetical protein
MAVSLTLVPALASAWEAKALTTSSAVAKAPEPAANGSDLQGGTSVSGDASAGRPSEAQHPDEHINAYKPSYKDVHVVDGSALEAMADEDEFPASYRSDEQVWATNVRVKDQRQTGACWAFCMTSAAEYSYAKELYEQTGELYAGELSPGHLVQFLYHRVMDPLENTEGDFNDIGTENGFMFGGDMMYGMQHLATWSGLVSESTAPFEEASKHVIYMGNGYVWDNFIDPYPSSLAYGHNELTLEESIYYSMAVPATIKRLVLRYGACGISMEWNSDYMPLDGDFCETDSETGDKYSFGRSFYNDASSVSANHGVALVGWDDSYPKENFRREVKGEDGETKTVMPKKDGAWIIQNSYGANVHDHGFFYASYESADFKGENPSVYAFDMQPSDVYAYNFQYDGTVRPSDSSDMASDGVSHLPYWTRPGTGGANVFTNTTGHPIRLEAVGFTTYNLGPTKHDVSVYTGLSDPSDPTSGICRGTTVVTTTEPGCKTGKLDQPVIVDEGETYSIVFHFPEYTAFGCEHARTTGLLRFHVQTEPGQSFFKPARSGSSWQDMDGYGACFRIKGFANPCTRDLDGAEVKLSELELTYDGKAQRPEILSIDGLQLAEGIDYAADWSNATSTSAGTYSVSITGMGDYTGTATATYRIGKAANPISLAKKTATVSYAKLRKAKQLVAGPKTTKAQGKVSYSLTKAVKGSKSCKGKFTIDKSSGKLGVAKGLAKGAYKLVVKASAAGNANYQPGSKTTVVTVRVR